MLATDDKDLALIRSTRCEEARERVNKRVARNWRRCCAASPSRTLRRGRRRHGPRIRGAAGRAMEIAGGRATRRRRRATASAAGPPSPNRSRRYQRFDGDLLASQQGSRGRPGRRDLIEIVVIGANAVHRGGRRCAAPGLIGLAWRIARSVAKPCATRSNVAKRIASGDLTVSFRSDSRDEVGRLVTASKAMQDTLGTCRGHDPRVDRAVELGEQARSPQGNTDLVAAHRGTGGEPGGDGVQHGGAHLDGEAERRQRAAGEPAGGLGVRGRRQAAATSSGKWCRRWAAISDSRRRRSPTSSA